MNTRGQDTTTIVLDDEVSGAPAPAGTPAVAIVSDQVEVVVDEDAGLDGELPDRAVRNPNGTITLPLRLQASIIRRSARNGDRSETITELTFGRLNGKAVRAVMSTSEANKPIVMLAKSTGLNEAVMNAVFDLMDAADIADAQQIVMSFFGSGSRAKTRS
ncbi:phage tail assembly protein [Ancylobacter pratisalsi]|uniref:Phage tail assembly protein n=1 Tax=Ancylobacter pratisalsi TaxID=1745854 RepID=A0A6P1YPX0_9HYPH|nr:phage tail assembly protein [Ancylobacter pratisalsi]QIB34746.1 hypothetical protein G3A50_14300 [Ancylobacter pratisalsi]